MKTYTFNDDGTVTYRAQTTNKEYTLGETELETLRLLSDVSNLECSCLLGHSIYPTAYKVGCTTFTHQELVEFLNKYDELQRGPNSLIKQGSVIVVRLKGKRVILRAVLLANGCLALINTATSKMLGTAERHFGMEDGIPFEQFCVHAELIEVVDYASVSY